jgi:cell division protein FtsI/penicillin-binding protein 2
MARSRRQTANHSQQRAKLLFLLILLGFLLVELRLFYWQVIKSHSLKTQAQSQTSNTQVISGERGKIFTADGHLLVGNKTTFDLFASKPELDIKAEALIEKITPYLIAANKQRAEGSEAKATQDSAQAQQIQAQLQARLAAEHDWIKLSSDLTTTTKQQLEKLKVNGLHFQAQSKRYYPEASMAAHVLGFVGKDSQGQDTGYFGLEGALEQELSGRKQQLTVKQDALGLKLADQKLNFNNLDGRDLTLTLRRDIQYQVLQHLQQGVERYQAQQGEIIVMDPSTGHIMALATWPHYDPNDYSAYQTQDFKNPSLADLYEPGSTFKTITVAAGIDAGAVTPHTPCPNCAGPRTIAGHTIRTWNEAYHPNITVKQALAKSDNIAMIFIAEAIGSKQFQTYLEQFGFGHKLDLDLQEDGDTPFPQKWGPVELATVSFGQGISTNSLQMVRAVGAIANHGVMMQPKIIKQVYDPQTEQDIDYPSQPIRKVISRHSAQLVTDMMVAAAQKGEAQWIGKNYSVAGKTGTSQIPSPDGGYKEEGTIASFIGFAPPQDPQFVMLVKLVEPQTSPWAAETAAPLWFHTAEDLFLLLKIPH